MAVVKECRFRKICRISQVTEKETNPLFRAVIDDDLSELQFLLQHESASVNAINRKGKSLLLTAIECKRIEIFDYLLGFDNINVDCTHPVNEQTPLMFLVAKEHPSKTVQPHKGHFISELIRKGANVHRTDHYYRNSTVLHFVLWNRTISISDRLTFCKIFIEKGVNVNAQDCDGLTPLHIACRKRDSDNAIHMLLYCGANATIADDVGDLPLVAVSKKLPIEEQFRTQEILFNHTFDGCKTTIPLATLVESMTYYTPVFWKILEIAGDLSYDVDELELSVKRLLFLQPIYFSVFIKQFGDVVAEMIETFPVMKMILERFYFSLSFDIKGMIQVFLESDLASNFVQTVDPTYSAVANFVDQMKKYKFPIGTEEEEITKMVCTMLTHGLTVTCTDLNAVYERYGHCELFKILLHMDIDMTDDKHYRGKMISLLYDPSTDITDLLETYSLPSHNIKSLPCSLLEYYNHSKLKEIFTKSNDEDKAAKAKNLPSLPLLVELSRNAARKYIVRNYNIKNARQFYTVLNWLPIGEMNKSIIALEKKLY